MQFAIKATDREYEIEILAVPFGSPADRDVDGQYFAADTNLHLDKFPNPPLVYLHGFDEGKKQAEKPIYVGKTIGYEVRADGVWFRGVLDRANAYARRVWEAAKQGLARASSGSVTHLVRYATDGKIVEWPLAELSVFDTGAGRNPANRHAVVLPALKAVYAEAGLVLPDFRVFQEERTMEAQELDKLIEERVQAAMKSDREQAEAARKAEEAVQARISAAVKAEREKLETEVVANRRLPDGAEMPYVAKFNNIWKYDSLDAADLAVGIGILDSAKSQGRSRSGATEDMRRALAVKVAEHTGDKTLDAAKSAMKMAGMPLKADELNRSTLANYGDEWVGVAYSSQLWDKIRLDTPVVGNIPTVEIPQGMESIVLPILGASPIFYKVGQTVDQAANPGRVTPTQITSRLTTANKTLTVGKLGAAVNYTGELEEDSLIPWLAQLRMDLIKEAAEVLEYVVIDGDTAAGANVNINKITGTPVATDAYMLFDGFRKLALVTNTANSRSTGVLDIGDYLETVKLMGLGGRNAVDKRNTAFIVDLHTHWKSLELPEIKTRDVFSAPTIEGGMLTNIYGYPVVVSGNMHRVNQDATYGLKANTAGKIDMTTAANNTTGSILAVRWDQWQLGYKRRMTFEVQRDAISDSSVIVVMMRVGMVNRDNEASAISYNVSV